MATMSYHFMKWNLHEQLEYMYHCMQSARDKSLSQHNKHVYIQHIFTTHRNQRDLKQKCHKLWSFLRLLFAHHWQYLES